MTILAFGINHTTAPTAIREKAIFSQDSLMSALGQLADKQGVNESAILSTCNRTEVYCSLEQGGNDIPIIWLSEYHGLAQGALEPFLYTYPDASAVRHILRVASGLDSMVLGEPQVLGQLKSAYNTGIKVGSIGKLLGRLFQYSFRVAKQIRTDTVIGEHPVSIAFATVRLAQQIFGSLNKKTALLIGTGSTIKLTARHLQEHGLSRMIIANRTFENSQDMAKKYSACAITLQDIPKYLAEADIVISATASQSPILRKDDFEHVIKARRHSPIFVVDIAVPRDVQAEVGELDDVYLYNVDDLKDVIQDNLLLRQQAAEKAEEIIDSQVTHFMQWLNSLDSVATIRALREQAQYLRDDVLELSKKELRRGDDPEQVLQNATRILTNKLIHGPSRQLRSASAGRRNELLDAANELFELDPGHHS